MAERELKAKAITVKTLDEEEVTWPLNEDEGYMVDPEVSIAKVLILSEEKVRITDLIPWHRIKRVQIHYEEVTPVAVVN